MEVPIDTAASAVTARSQPGHRHRTAVCGFATAARPLRSIAVKTRIGGVPYGAGAPLLTGLNELPNIEFVPAQPNELIPQLRTGKLAAALVPSIEAIRQPGYSVAAGMGIACKHEMASARAFRRTEHAIRTVGLDRNSATSVALLRLLLANVYLDDVAPGIEFETIAPTARPDELPHDLVLLIGDNAHEADPGEREIWDLGKAWRDWTGLPFVFGLWVLHKDADPDAVLPALHAAQARGRGASAGDSGGAHYELDEQDLRGLCRFWSECRALELGRYPDPPMVD